MAFKYPLCRYFGAKVYTIWVHGPLYPKPYIGPKVSLKGILLKGSLFGYMDPVGYSYVEPSGVRTLNPKP